MAGHREAAGEHGQLVFALSLEVVQTRYSVAWSTSLPAMACSAKGTGLHMHNHREFTCEVGGGGGGEALSMPAKSVASITLMVWNGSR